MQKKYKKEKGNEKESGKKYNLRKEGSFSFVPEFLETETVYTVKVKAVVQGKESEWGEEIEFTTPEFSECCAWKECPDCVAEDRRYSVEEENPRVATNNGDHCTIIGNTPLPLNKVTSWNIKILNSEGNDGRGIYIGVAPFDIDQNEDYNHEKCGWYFYCYGSTLRSGPPHSYEYPGKEYGPRKEDGEYVHTGDSVGVVMDTTKGELSFALDGVSLGVAYDGIPLDKPLVPCVLLGWGGDSVELII